MSDPIDFGTPKSSKRWISKIFRSKSGTDVQSDAGSIAEPLVKDGDHVKSTTAADRVTFGDLMEQAKTMEPEEFRKYLRRFKEDQEAHHRRLGGGIAGGGDWCNQGQFV